MKAALPQDPLRMKGNMYVDFEFNRVSSRYVNLVCAVVRVKGEAHKYWLHNDRQAWADLATDLKAWLRSYRLVCYGAIAESRSLLALGINPLEHNIIDLWAEVRLLHNHNSKYQYGRYFFMGEEKCSVPPHIVPAMNKGKDMTEIRDSLVASQAFFLGHVRSGARKEQMRRLIIDDPADFTQEERTAIMDYCEEDVIDLPRLHAVISKAEMDELQWTAEQVILAQVTRGSYSASMALCETEGIPLDVQAATHLSRNVEQASNAIIQDLVTNHYPFFTQKTTGEWTQTAAQLAAYIEEKGLTKSWPKTPSGAYAADEDTLEDFSGFSEINQLRRARKVLGQLKWFRDEAWAYFFEHVDIYESRLRTWLNPFGTQSNRNAPPAKVFVPAMSNWLRCLIRPQVGHVIDGIDWASQEFAIAAMLSQDPKMLEAYRSGDPYVYFAKEAGAIPKDADAKWVKDPSLAPEDQQAAYIKYAEARDLFKATVLGLQYGMGNDKLSRKLSMDTGKVVTVNQAAQLKDMHKRIFYVYWAWLDSLEGIYSKSPLILWDGWAMFKDNHSTLSMKNFPVQGTGSVIMRRAILKAQREGIKVLFPLHDAIYILRDEKDTRDLVRMEQLMDEAVQEVLGDMLYIRHDCKTVTNSEPWIEKRGKKMYDLLSKYLRPMEKPEGEVEKSTVRRKKKASEKNN